MAGFAAAVLTVLDPQLIALDGALMAEAVLLPLVAGALLLPRSPCANGWLGAGAWPSSWRSALSSRSPRKGVARPCSSYPRALAVPVALVAGPGDARARLRRLAAVLLPVVILLGAWTVRTAAPSMRSSR